MFYPLFQKVCLVISEMVQKYWGQNQYANMDFGQRTLAHNKVFLFSRLVEIGEAVLTI